MFLTKDLGDYNLKGHGFESHSPPHKEYNYLIYKAFVRNYKGFFLYGQRDSRAFITVLEWYEGATTQYWRVNLYICVVYEVSSSFLPQLQHGYIN